jgi:superfamily II DNA or RNA helicase
MNKQEDRGAKQQSKQLEHANLIPNIIQNSSAANYSHFITNQAENSLSSHINNILPKTDKLDFLVGFFYFSGIKEIYENIKDKKMRILVGLNMETRILDVLHDIELKAKKHSSIGASKQDIYDLLIKIFSESDYFENTKTEEAFKIYYEKIKDGTLEIRKTNEPCHAKLYIFSYKETENGRDPGTVITGSSNLTYNGLTAQSEINVRLRNPDEHKEALHIFNTLWKDAYVIAGKANFTEFEEQVMKRVWYEKLPIPYLMYVRALYEYFYIDTTQNVRLPYDITENDDVKNLKYQEFAIRQALQTIERHNGVIIADVVGLGKSVIAAAIANNLDLQTLIIAPPHLLNQWQDYKNDYRIRGKVFSRGLIKEALDYYNQNTKKNKVWLIILDEAHHYRNEDTKDYAMLHEICSGNKAALLSATPFNNRPSDIYSMIKLFQIPEKSTLQTVSNLGEKFSSLISRYKELEKEYKNKKIQKQELELRIKDISSEIRKIISPVIIRRSRLDLKEIPEFREDLKVQNIKFSKVSDPKLLTYDLAGLKDTYLRTLEKIYNEESKQHFKAVRYESAYYIKADCLGKVKEEIEKQNIDFNLFKTAQRNLADFMRTMLVRRFESSIYSFKISLNRMLANYENIQKWIKRRSAIPIYKKGRLPDIDALYDESQELFPIEIENMQDKGFFEIKTKYLKEEFFTFFEQDLELLKDLKQVWESITDDPKVNDFIKKIKEQIKKDAARKIVVFSQFSDTIDYIYAKLEEEKLPVFSYTSKTSSKTSKEIIRKNFDAGLPASMQSNDYQILTATDAISEGYNLHRAGTVFNYDIAYNPTRIIQRVGRINRINKKVFDELYIYNYFPSVIGEDETNIQKISTLKMAMIHSILGEDAKILTPEEVPKSQFGDIYKKLYGNIFKNEEEYSWDTPYRKILNSLQDGEDLQEALTLPLRCKIKRIHSENEGCLIFVKKGADFIFKFADKEQNINDISPEKAFKILEAKEEEKSFVVSKHFNAVYEKIKQSLTANAMQQAKKHKEIEALARIKYAKESNKLPLDYTHDLMNAIKLKSIPAYLLGEIINTKIEQISNLPNRISASYIQKILASADRVESAKQTLIFSQELFTNEESNV